MNALPSSGTILAAAAALRARRGGTWTNAEVAVLLQLAYESGRADSYREDLAELHAAWEDHPPMRMTYEERVGARVESLRSSRRDPQRVDHPGGPVDWETGQPARHLAVVA